MAIAFEQLISNESKLFAKSEFGPAHSNWPALSFSSNKIARDFQGVYRRARDFVIYVGTSNPVDTPNPQHRQRLVSVIDVEPRAIVQTKQIVDPASWARAQERYPGRWDVSLRLARAWDVIDLPRAHDLLPATYAKFRNPGTRGHPIPVEEADYFRLKLLNLSEVSLTSTNRSNEILNLNVDDALLRRELTRLTDLVQSDIARALQERGGVYPIRTGTNFSETFNALKRRWDEQRGMCALCGEAVPLQTSNKLRKMSRDRIDSSNKSYEYANIQITHYACNLAKSDATMSEWQDFLAMLQSPAP